MIKNDIKILKHVLIVGMIFLTISCNVTPELTGPSSTTPTIDKSVGTLGVPVTPVPITLDRVSIFTHSSNKLTGTVTVEIANGDGTVVLGSSVLAASGMIGDKWTTFFFAPITLMAGTKYRIQVKRSIASDFVTDFIFWGSSDGSTDAYKKGNSFVVTSPVPIDMTFVTFSGGYVDQQQTTHTNFWGIMRYVHWQEFVPEKIWVNHQ